MRLRIIVATAVVVLLAGCTSTVTGAGTVSGGSSPRPPCSSDPVGSSTAPGCTPAPSPDPGPSTGSASRWAPYARSVFSTRLGDPGVLNVCAIALGAKLPSGLRFVKPDATLAASCKLLVASAGAPLNGSAVQVAISRDPVSLPSGKGVARTTVLGQSVLAESFVASRRSCRRTLVLPRADVVTALEVDVFGTVGDGGAAVTCGVTSAVVRSFAEVAAGSVDVPIVPTASPSLLRLDACKVAVSAGFTSRPPLDAIGADPRSAHFDTSCAWSRGGRNAFVSTGLLRSSSNTPDGVPVTVDGHPLYRARDRSSCQYTSKQAEGETVEAYYAPIGDPPSDSVCAQVGSALGRYLDVLGLD